MVDVVALTSGLRDASIGGVPFLYIDSKDEPGRRVLKILFPGSDIPAFVDLGGDDGPIAMTGMVIGDDWIAQANALRAVFSQRGPYRLVHPWLGTFLVMPEKRPTFTDSQSSIRCTKFEISLWRYTPPQPVPPSTLDTLLDALAALRAAANAALAQILAPAALVVSAISAVNGFVGQATGWIDTAVAGGLEAVAAPGLASLQAVATLAAGADYAAGVAAAFTAPFDALAAASNPPLPAAIGPGQQATMPTPIDGRLTAEAMLTVAAAAASETAGATPAPELALALQAYALADACSAASDIVYTDATEAATWRDEIAAALDTAADAAALAASTAIAPASPVALGGLWAALLAARQAWMADMSSEIGRLPTVAILTLPATPVSVWLVAQYLSGDDPASLVATVDALMARNGLYSPAITAPTVEFLQ